jgi:hypothetical protein
MRSLRRAEWNSGLVTTATYTVSSTSARLRRS